MTAGNDESAQARGEAGQLFFGRRRAGTENSFLAGAAGRGTDSSSSSKEKTPPAGTLVAFHLALGFLVGEAEGVAGVFLTFLGMAIGWVILREVGAGKEDVAVRMWNGITSAKGVAVQVDIHGVKPSRPRVIEAPSQPLLSHDQVNYTRSIDASLEGHKIKRGDTCLSTVTKPDGL